MSLSSGSPLQTEAFKQHVRRHCEQKLAEGLPTSSPHANRLHPASGPRFQLHEQRRSSDGQLPPMFPSKGVPIGSTRASQQFVPKTKSGGVKPPVGDVRRSSDGQLPPMFPVNDGQIFVGPPPAMMPRQIKPIRGTDPVFDAELRRSSDGQLQPKSSTKDPFKGPPTMMIPKHIQQQSGSAEVQVSPKEFRVDVDVAAYAPEELAVKIVGDHVVIKGKHAEGSPGEKANVTREFSRRYTLPEDVIVEDVSVFLAKTGKLSVKVPRRMKDHDEKHAAEKHTTERKSKVKFKE
ncbi:uncharacterized protein LOC119745474 [Patiria miniata]|uniref:SHSP domain-containing protein n=1 Tax=Patiria miniata TaxID=46514 RepID=A0A914BNQ9_PATMI|nr:uncharacterized protein LOC119745474 [Patiria miniata]